MHTLTCGERAVRCLLGEETDRAPFGVGLGWQPWSQTLARWKQESGDPALAPRSFFGFDASFALSELHAGIWPPFERVTLEETEASVVFCDERGITQRSRRDGSMPEFLDYPVKTPADWGRLKAERLNPCAPGRVAQDWDSFRARLARTGEAVQVGAYPFGVFGTPRDLLGVDRLLLSFYDEPEMIRDMMEHLTNLWIALWERVAAEVRIDHIHIWEDMAGKQGSMISPAMVNAFMMPCYDRIASFARRVGARVVSVDTDGWCAQLLPVMTAHGVNVFFPFEVQAGNDILDYRRRYPELGIWGGLDKRALALDRAAIDREVGRVRAMLAQGRYLPGFDHLIPPDVPWENFRYAAERLREACHEARNAVNFTCPAR